MFAVTILNILGECAIRGLGAIEKYPQLFIAIPIIYFTYACVIEDSISRYKLKDKQTYILGMSLCFLWQLCMPLAVIAPPRILGLNIGVLIFINILMWPAVQTVLFFYIAQRLFPRDNNQPFLGLKVRNLMIALFCGVTLVMHLGFGLIGYQNIIGVVVLILLGVGCLRWFKNSLQKLDSQANKFYSRFIDGIGGITIILLVYAAFFIPMKTIAYNEVHLLNQNAFGLLMLMTLIVPLFMLFYRMKSKNTIPV